MYVSALREMTCSELRAAVGGFSERYVSDWDAWLRVDPRWRPTMFGQILRRWQATRPRRMRRTRADRLHEAPFLEDLLDQADGRLRRLGNFGVEAASKRTNDQESALVGLWSTFEDLAVPAPASSVGISKAVLLVTNGRIGPALDSIVQRRLGVPRPISALQWISLLSAVAEDIAAFEARNGSLPDCVPARHRHLAYGRLYDMALGPR